MGGPCLPKDPYVLLTHYKSQLSIIRTARLINDHMPDHVVNILLNELVSSGKQRKEISVLILGASYKPGVNNTRTSPTQTIVSRLMEEGITKIALHDAYTTETFGAKAASDLYGSLSESKCVILATAHLDYFGLQPHMFRKDCIILDTVRVLKEEEEFTKSGLNYNSIG